ncbi:uncharacterized protein LOC141673338 [Apium graveolens]|uniref:uncharacterized protein LOC141673338 n=1 Tax=Apium graveolens TaxID=4045 RepID=UPI003D79767C
MMVRLLTLQKTEKRDGQELDRQPQETRKAIGELSRPWGDTQIEDNDQTFGFLERPQNINKGSPCGQAVLDDLNAKISTTANTLRNQQQQSRTFSSNSSLDLFLSLCIPGTEGNQKVKREGTSVESQRKRKGTFDAFDNVTVSSLKSRRLMEMGKFLEKPFTSYEIVDLESENTDGRTRPVATAYAKHDSTPRKYEKATGESSGPHEDEHKGPVKKSGTGVNPRVGNILNMEAPQIGRPLSPINEVCILSRNPADFSVPGPDNIYMIQNL